MDTEELTNVIQETTDYDKFALLTANRQINRRHVEDIKKSIEEYGNFTRIEPIIVNQRLQIIDGQHRYMACLELGLPIFYMVFNNLTAADARKMNLLNRPWNANDFALHYAQQGNENYQQYLKLKEEYGFGHAVLSIFCAGRLSLAGYGRFKSGNFEIPDLEQTKKWLDMMVELQQYIAPKQPSVSRGTAQAFLTIFKSPNYNHREMVDKMRRYADTQWVLYGRTEDTQRMIEEIYNIYRQNRVRLF